MNFKTSIFLCIVLVVVLVGFLTLRSQQAQEAEPETPKPPTAELSQPLFDEPPEEVVAVTCTQGEQGPWRFERATDEDGGASGDWQLADPIEAKVTGYLVDGIVNRLKGLRYRVKHEAGESGGVTLEQAGLSPPRAVVEMKAEDGTAYTVQVGKPASGRETYVGLPDSDAVYVVQTSLDNLVRDRLVEYLDKSMLEFDANDAVSIQVTYKPLDAEATEYRLTKAERADWVFEAPFDADADDEAVLGAIRAMARLRAAEWITADASVDVGRYGLEPPELDIRVTCEVVTEVPVEDEEGGDVEEGEEAAEPETIEKIETNHYRLLVAGRGPLGKDQQVYAKVADMPGVAAIAKPTAEKLKPNIDEWRNMEVLRADVSGATKIRIQSGEDPPFTLLKTEEGKWTFEDEGGLADKEAVDALIKDSNSLRAVAFVDDADPGSPEFGLTEPSVEIHFTLPGREAPERLTVGGPTDATAKRLYYVRYRASTSIAKVRAADVQPLMRDALAYENKQITDLPVSDIDFIELTRPNPITDEPETIELERRSGQAWRIVAPIERKTDPTTVTGLVTALASLEAERVIARTAEPTAYRFDAPTAQAAISYRELPDMAGAGAGAGDSGDPADLGPQERTLLLEFVDIGHTIYARRSDKPAVYAVRRADYASLLEELGDKTIWDIGDGDVVAASVKSGESTHRFEKQDDEWVYAGEPDLPIDGAKVDALVKRIRELKIDHFVAYGVDDPAEYGLAEPERTIHVETNDGRSATLLISASPCAGGPRRSHCAIIEGGSNVFSLKGDLSGFDVRIADFEISPSS